MILNEINHKMPMYKDCTLGEIALVILIAFLILLVIFSLISEVFSGYLWPAFIVAILGLWPLTKFLLTRLQRLKYGKPHGYYQQLLQKKLQNSFLRSILKTSHVERLGKWSVRRVRGC